MIINIKLEYFFVNMTFFSCLVTNSLCVTFRQCEVSNVKHKEETKQNDQEHEPVALHRMVSIVIEDDSF
jgi:hypothetical protein